MATVSILPISDPKGEKSYRALAGDKHSEGKTAGQALDALTAQLGEIEKVKYLEMNSPAQIGARQLWLRLGLFP